MSELPKERVRIFPVGVGGAPVGGLESLLARDLRHHRCNLLGSTEAFHILSIARNAGAELVSSPRRDSQRDPELFAQLKETTGTKRLCGAPYTQDGVQEVGVEIEGDLTCLGLREFLDSRVERHHREVEACIQ